MLCLLQRWNQICFSITGFVLIEAFMGKNREMLENHWIWNIYAYWAYCFKWGIGLKYWSQCVAHSVLQTI